jgi:4,5-dihydroxyphthalate decarboxylase
MTLACGDYDRTQALHNGRVGVDGVDLHCVNLPASEIFVRMNRDEEFDVAEMSLSMYTMGLARGDDRFVALPIFPLRAFRHRDIYVAADGEVRHPDALRGKRVGLRHFHMTSAVWQRGFLADSYGVPAAEIEWVRAEAEVAGPTNGRLRYQLPNEISLTTVTTASIADLVSSGELAAGFVAAPIYRAGVRRLFDDPAAVEREYHRATGIYPIMHVMVVRRAYLSEHLWVGQAILRAFERAKTLAYQHIRGSSSPSMLPFNVVDLERDLAEFGGDLYPYGLTSNLPALDTFRRYSEEQGLSTGLPPVPEWFELSPAANPIPPGKHAVETREVFD